MPSAPHPAATPVYDLLIRNATLIDGSGAPRRCADIAIAGGRIAALGALADAQARASIDAAGRIAAPGFIDAHTHDDRLLLSDPQMTPKLSQGVTTVVAGNCGISLARAPAPRDGAATPPLDLLDGDGAWSRFADFRGYRAALEAHPAALNAACMLGHTTLRVAVMDRVDRQARPSEIARMRAMAEEAMAHGAIGISTGTAYQPAEAASTEEIIEVCRPLSAAGGRYVTHMRNEDDAIIEAMEETFRIGRELGVPVVISHHKAVGSANHGRSRETLALIERRRREQPIALDCYPYIASSTVMRADRLAQSSRVLVTWSKPHPEFAGMDLRDVAAALGVSQAEAVERLLPAGAVYFMLDEADVQRILAFDETMIGSDGLPHDARPHPRLWGTFPRVLGHYARDLGLFSLETAVRKMTALSAEKFGLAGRGRIAEGCHADITLFDADRVIDHADFDHPTRPAGGIDLVIVNGVVAWRDGAPTGSRSGQLITP